MPIPNNFESTTGSSSKPKELISEELPLSVANVALHNEVSVGLETNHVSLLDSDPLRYESLSPPGDIFRKVLDRKTREVIVKSEIDVENYDKLAEHLGPWAVRDMDYLKQSAMPLKGKHIEEVNPTANGGGVQMILATQVNLLRKLGIFDRWRLMNPNAEAFRATKDWHNTFQGVAKHSIEHLDAGIKKYESWIDDDNTEPFIAPFADAVIVTLHDPQPHKLIHLVPDTARSVWRSHIQNRADLIDTP